MPIRASSGILEPKAPPQLNLNTLIIFVNIVLMSSPEAALATNGKWIRKG